MSLHASPARLSALAAAAGLIVSCGPPRPPAPPVPEPIATPVEPAPTDEDHLDDEPALVEVGLADVGLDPAALDPDADPCADFYRYACGGWLDATEIPADRARWGRFSEISERNEEALRSLLEGAATADDPAARRLGAFYAACMDEEAIEAAGTEGIAPLLAATRGVKDAATLRAALATLHRHQIWAAFSLLKAADFRDSSTNILFIDTAGLGLPDRDYYLKDDAEMVRVRTFYRGHVQRMFELSGMPAAAARRAAADVLRIETVLARVTKSRVERRDIPGLYNPHDRAELGALAASVGWDDYFAALGHPGIARMSVTTPRYFEALDRALRRPNAAAWRHYLTWQVLHATAPSLPAALADEAFALTAAVTGQAEQKPRWKRCVSATDGAMGEQLGKLYVARHFAGGSRAAAEQMVREIGLAFAARLEQLEWMSPETRQQARVKLERMSHLIGYPDTFETYDFEVTGNHAANTTAASAFALQRELGKVGKPVDPLEWRMTPPTVNAYYSPLLNQMVFPAGILQPPFFGADRGVAANLGGMGMVVGHELTHGFDDQGALFDGDGNLMNWWQPEDAERFAARGECLVEQYDRYEVLPGVHVNGKLTLGENIADLGGVKLAFRAYRNLRRGATRTYQAGGLSEDQQFFLAVGQAWCNKDREAETRRRIVVDSHAPPRFRVNGALTNLPEFAEAFSCPEGAPMRPAEICEVW